MGGGLHLYRMSSGNWCLNNDFQPDENRCLAHVSDSFSESPPAGESLWQLGRSFGHLKALGAGADSDWATGPLALFTGADAVAPAERLQAQVEAAEQAKRDAAAAVMALGVQPVAVFGGEDVKPKYREVLLLPTGKRANDRPVWSTPNGGGLHL